jgi:hypothetical protein
MSFDALDKQQKLLPVICKPYPNELLSSWLTRLAFKHGLNPKVFCQLIWQGKVSIDIDRHVKETQMQLLAQRTGLSFETIRQMTLWSFEHKVFGEMQEGKLREDWMLMGRRIMERKRLPIVDSGVLFCPGCFQKGRTYFKKEWRIATSFVCVSCASYLLEGCPHCRCGSWLFDDIPLKADQTLEQYLITCHNCGRDVSDCTIQQAPEALVEMQRELYRIAESSIWKAAITTVSYFQMLYELANVLFFNRQSMFGLGNFTRLALVTAPDHNDNLLLKIPSVKFIPLKLRWKYVLAAFRLLEDWPNNCRKLLKRCHLDQADRGALLGNRPAWFTQPVIDALKSQPWDNCFQKTRISQHTDYMMPVESDNDYHDYDHNDNCFYDYLFDKNSGGCADVIEGIYNLYGFKPSIQLDEVY